MPEIFNTWLLLQQTYKNEQTDVNTRANTADYLGDYKESRGWSSSFVTPYLWAETRVCQGSPAQEQLRVKGTLRIWR